jgi:hypothetical protein
MSLVLGFGEAAAALCSCHCRMRSRTEFVSYRSSGLLSEALDVGGALRRLFDARRGVVGAEGIGEHVDQDASYAETSPSAVVVGAEILGVFQALVVSMISMDGCLHLSCMLCEYNTSKVGRRVRRSRTLV